MKSIKERLSALREQMAAEKISAYIIPSNDPHMSEYVSDYWNLREYISGFTGSAGTVVVTMTKAGLWTDGRYFQQAPEELQGSTIDLYKMGVAGTPSIISFLKSTLKSGERVGAAAINTMQSDADRYTKSLAAAGIKFKLVEDLVGRSWTDRPVPSKRKIFEHDVTYAGADRKSKIKALLKDIKSQGAQANLVTALDEIAWLLNLRGYDVAFNPVFYAYLWVEKKNTVLFIDQKKVKTALLIELGKQGIQIEDYKNSGKLLKKLSKNKVVAIDPKGCNAAIYGQLRASEIVSVNSPAKLLKAIKNETEIRHLKDAMIKDGVALAKAFRWLSITLSARTVSEYELGEKLAYFRSQQEGYYGESFNPIVGYESNGAVIHYRAKEEGSKMIERRGVLLVDSGGQYFNGTTDITRTFALGPVTPEQKMQYTLVLKGHIALAKIHFPPGTTGIQLDAITRQFLWNAHLNYNHGTGHGVGFFMNVHEPPQGFAPKLNERGNTVHEAGMYSSNEPGYYLEGSHGIRLENLVICVPAGEDTTFLRHETITLYPFDLNFIDRSLMTDAEVAWLNAYHQKVARKLTPHLDAETAGWIAHQCRPIH